MSFLATVNGLILQKYSRVLIFQNMSIYEIFNTPSNRGWGLGVRPFRVSQILPCFIHIFERKNIVALAVSDIIILILFVGTVF